MLKLVNIRNNSWKYFPFFKFSNSAWFKRLNQSQPYRTGWTTRYKWWNYFSADIILEAIIPFRFSTEASCKSTAWIRKIYASNSEPLSRISNYLRRKKSIIYLIRSFHGEILPLRQVDLKIDLIRMNIGAMPSNQLMILLVWTSRR